MPTRSAALACALALFSGCGSGAPLPPAAEPARSPAATTTPAGRVVDLGAPIEGVTADRSGIVAAALRDEVVLLDGETLDEIRRVPRHGAADRLLGPPLGTDALDDGTEVLVEPRERRLRVGNERHPAGVGPTDVAVGDGSRVYVTDTDGGSVLLFRAAGELALARRAAVPGKPYAAATDRERGKLWVTVTQTNEAVQLTADGAPRIQRRFPTVRQPNAIAVDDRSGRVVVGGAQGELQVFDGYPES